MPRKIGIILSIVLGLGILFTTVFYIRGTRPITRAEKEAIEFASDYVKFETVSEFYWFTRQETYYTLVGTTDNSKEVIAFIPQSGEKLTLLNQSDGITHDQAMTIVEKDYQPNKILKVNLGMIKKEPVWEIVVQNEDESLNYYLLTFSDGEIVSIIENV